ncbi:MAG: hypothetical protein A3H32_06745 [Betaproteobacteria bacterium RIFCSPLOWO2_02_FULL_63_19]|nr:MAG: hypothetical protein A3H32_06745 [Betaproteobacteria bacterium RIFCSPLOWO2_02_FULL_63_19]
MSLGFAPDTEGEVIVALLLLSSMVRGINSMCKRTAGNSAIAIVSAGHCISIFQRSGGVMKP